MFMGLGLRLGAAGISAPGIQITTGAYMDADLMLVGDQIGSAFVPGVYPPFQGNAVSESDVKYYVYAVDPGPGYVPQPSDEVASTYVLQAGDLVGQAKVTLSATGATNRVYYSGIETIVDYSADPGDLEWQVPPGGGAVPSAFVVGNWSIADAATSGDATVTITALPADNGSAITDLEYRVNGGAAVSWAATTTGSYAISGLPDGTSVNVEIRAENANGPGAWSDVKAVTTTGVPSAFTAGQWSIADDGTGGDATLTISTLPATNGSAITDLQRKIGAGSWTSLGGTSTGTYDLDNLFTDGVATNVVVRAVNAVGNGADSDTKSVTTSAPAGITGHDAPQVLTSTASQTTYSLGNVTGVQVGDLVTVHLHGMGDSVVLNPANFTGTLGGVSLSTPINQTASTSSGVFVAGAAFQIVAGAAGDLALDVNMAVGCRGVIAVVWLEQGYDSGTPRGLIHAPGSGTSSVTTQAIPPSGFTTGRNGNTYKASVSIKGGDVTSVTMSGVDGSGTTNSGGTSSTQDLSIAYGWIKTPTAAAITPSASWTTSARAVALGTETNL